MMTQIEEIERKLKAPFPANEVKWRVGSVSIPKNKVQLLAYVDARAVQDRLDSILGLAGWESHFQCIEKNFICSLTVHLPHPTQEGQRYSITKSDGAEQTDFEGWKGGISDAFKRAAVQFGVGRYLYASDAPWVEVIPQKPKGAPYGSYNYVNYSKKGETIKGFYKVPSLGTPSPAPKKAPAKKAAPKLDEAGSWPVVEPKAAPEENGLYKLSMEPYINTELKELNLEQARHYFAAIKDLDAVPDIEKVSVKAWGKHLADKKKV